MHCAMPESAPATSAERVPRPTKVRPRIMLAPLPKPSSAAQTTARPGKQISPSSDAADIKLTDTAAGR